MIDVSVENFQAEVIDASASVPVLVDFWAPWCGPCRTLIPALEELEVRYAGRFKLAKVNVDEQQQIAAAFGGIRSVPTCILMVRGQPVDAFTGALPPAQIREFLDRFVPAGDEVAIDDDSGDGEDLQEQVNKLVAALEADAENDELRERLVRLLLSGGDVGDAKAVIAPALAREPRPMIFEFFDRYCAAIDFVGSNERSLEDLDFLISKDKRDFQARFDRARVLLVGGDVVGAMDELLEVIMRDKKWGAEEPRLLYVAILEIMSPPKAAADKKAALSDDADGAKIEIAGAASHVGDEVSELVSRYRRKLSMALN